MKPERERVELPAVVPVNGAVSRTGNNGQTYATLRDALLAVWPERRTAWTTTL